ncbi:hypothetical protein [Actinoplanes aureus]|uniref:Trypsin-like peptidase domain-containing protein n=1 Tax=Actinoplanes aureus TaxID=2792083 RepID=A0A931G1S2_9ACTN|nr:hypothetical protein [Actinoplanes aureus]MBG0565456.1 hypothetical protein [Actinoplanes aureus]
MASGVVLRGGRVLGSGVSLKPGLVVTAGHVLGDCAADVLDVDGAKVLDVLRDDEFDLALLHTEPRDGAEERIGRPLDGQPWWADARPRDNDPILTGRIVSSARTIATGSGDIEVVQLTVDQRLAEYGGYSGAAVRSGLPGDPGGVCGILIEQVLERTEWSGSGPPAANVLYAVPISLVLARFGLTGLPVAPPRRFTVPAPPVGMIERRQAIDDVVSRLPGGDVVIRAPGGRGKTVLAQQAGHDTRLWEAFPGGILWLRAGPGADSEEIWARLTGDGTTLPSGPATLVVVDDVWSDTVLADLRGRLPGSARMLATSRGVAVAATTGYTLGGMAEEEALTVLARGASRTAELDEALRRLASALHHLPLLLESAGRYLHLADLDLDALDEPAPAEPAELRERAEQLLADFTASPTVLDDPGGTRSVRHLVRSSLDALAADDRRGYDDLAVFPVGAQLSSTLLADLWGLNRTATRQRMTRLYRVGLASVVRRDPLTFVLHDLHVAELHERCGASLGHVHDRCAGPALEAGGLTAERADWLVHHLLRGTGRHPVDLVLEPAWRGAYRVATGSDARYLRDRRAVIRYLGEHGEPSVPTVATMLGALLTHASLTARISAAPVDALVAYALLGSPDAALLQAFELTDRARAVHRILTALEQNGRPLRPVVDRALELAEGLDPPASRVETILAVASVVADDEPERAYALTQRAVEYVTTRPVSEHGWELVPVVAGLAAYDTDAALRLAETVPGVVASCKAFAVVAAALAERDRPAAEALLDRAVAEAGIRPGALGRIAEAVATALPERAVELARRAFSVSARDHSGRQLVVEMIAAVFPEVAAEVAETVGTIDEWTPAYAAIRACEPLARIDPGRAVALAAQLAEQEWRDSALAGVVTGLSATDPGRAADLAVNIVDPWCSCRAWTDVAVGSGEPDVLDLAVRAAEGISDPRRRAVALRDVVEQWAALDPEHAAGLAGSLITNPAERGFALAQIAAVAAPARPDLAARLIQEYHTAELVPWAVEPLSQVVRLASVWARRDPAAAARMAFAAIELSEAYLSGIDRRRMRSQAVSCLAGFEPDAALAVADGAADPIAEGNLVRDVVAKVAESDPRRAAELLSLVPDFARPGVDETVVVALASKDPGAARAVYGAMDNRWERLRVLPAVAAALARHDPVLAVGLVTDADDVVTEALGLAKVAQALAGTWPEQARVLAHRAESLADGWSGKVRAEVLAEVAVAQAVLDPGRAIALADTIDDLTSREACLERLVIELAPGRPSQARHIADRMRFDFQRDRALATVARRLIEDGPETAEQVAGQIRDAELADRVLLDVGRGWPGRARDVVARLQKRVQERGEAPIRNGAAIAGPDAGILGTTWSLAPRADVLAIVCLRHCADFEAALALVRGLLESWDGEDPGPVFAAVDRTLRLGSRSPHR